MAKEKLIEMRKFRKYTQQYVAEKLGMEVSGYTKRENGQVKISQEHWEKLAEIFDVPQSAIYEDDVSQTFIFKDNASSNYWFANNISHEAFIETLLKYVRKIEEENTELRQQIMKK